MQSENNEEFKHQNKIGKSENKHTFYIYND